MNQVKTISIALPILIISLTILSLGCSSENDAKYIINRFDTDLFSIHPDSVEKHLSKLRNKYPEFLPIFTEHIIGIGHINDPNLDVYLKQFIQDPVIAKVYAKTQNIYSNFDHIGAQIATGITNYYRQTGSTESIKIIGFISGFNQSFVSLDSELAIGLDNYLGADYEYYKQLGLPSYIIDKMSPDFIVADALRAWVQSDLEGSFELETVLDNIIFEGKIIYTAMQVLDKNQEKKILKYNSEQLKWCRDNEKSMWKFMVEKEMLFNTEALMIQRLSKEAPFTRDFGMDSPPKAGAWIGYRIVEKFMSRNNVDIKDLLFNFTAKEILAKSAYSP